MSWPGLLKILQGLRLKTDFVVAFIALQKHRKGRFVTNVIVFYIN